MSYAYMLLSSEWPSELEKELSGWYYGDIIEAHIEAEEQAVDCLDLYPYGWDAFASRVAPVQVTEHFNPIRGLRDFAAMQRVAPSFDQVNVVYFPGTAILQCGFDLIPESVAISLCKSQKLVGDRDGLRFAQVLLATLSLARHEQRGLLFIGGEGWYYEMEIAEEKILLMEKTGFLFADRHR